MPFRFSIFSQCKLFKESAMKTMIMSDDDDAVDGIGCGCID